MTAAADEGGGGGAAGAGGLCAVTSLTVHCCSRILDRAAAAALGASLRRGARLEELAVSGSCGRGGDALAAQVADALLALGASARLRNLNLRCCEVTGGVEIAIGPCLLLFRAAPPLTRHRRPF